jgi:hypothetical protein
VAPIVVPQLGRDEHLLAVQATACDRVAHALVVAAGDRGIDQPVADLEGVQDRVGCVLWRDLKHAEAELRDSAAVEEIQIRD